MGFQLWSAMLIFAGILFGVAMGYRHEMIDRHNKEGPFQFGVLRQEQPQRKRVVKNFLHTGEPISTLRLQPRPPQENKEVVGE